MVPAPMTILYEGEHTRVLRVSLPDRAGSLIVKELRGPRVAARRRHEVGVLERLGRCLGRPATGVRGRIYA